MQAARLYDGADALVVEEVPLGALQPTECRVGVRACGICASDLHAIEGRLKTAFRPIILGHEAAGVVAEVGSEVTGFSPGEHVCINPIITCGRCDACLRGRPHICKLRSVLGIHRDGAMAQFVSVPEGNLVRLPDDLPFEEAAIIESASTPFHALTNRAPVKPGDAVAIFGVGGIGIHAVQIARIAGASLIVAVDIAEEPLQRALRVGATEVINAGAEDPVRTIRKLSGGGVDVSAECVGHPQTQMWATKVLRPGGVGVIMGVGNEPTVLPPTNILNALEIDIRFVFAYSRPELERVARLVATRQLDARVAVSEVYELGAVNEALHSFREKTRFPVRILVKPPATSSCHEHRVTGL